MEQYIDHQDKLINLINEALGRARLGTPIDLELTEMLLIQAADEARQARIWPAGLHVVD